MNEQIDIKSLLIGTLLTATIFLGVAATSPTDKWDAGQQWKIDSFNEDVSRRSSFGQFHTGEQPFAVTQNEKGKGVQVWTRSRIK